jgi:hypothetical protein
MPPPARSLDLLPKSYLVGLNEDIAKLSGGNVRIGTVPASFIHDEFHGLDPFACSLVIPIPYAHQSVSVVFQELLRAALSRPQRQTCP